MSIDALARPEIRRLAPYQAATQVEDSVRLNANEAPWSSGADHFRRPLNRYPEIRPQRLRRALASRFGCTAEQLLVTRGSSEAIDLLIRAFCRPGIDNVVTTAPSFSMYAHYAVIQGARLHEVATSRASDFAVDADALLRACDGTTRLVFLCSPNNPTGTSVPSETIAALLSALDGRSLVVVDEAYVEFSGRASATSLLERHDNLVVLRTLSKALAFAGTRCGAAIACERVIDMLDAIQAPYALATPVVECVEDALQNEWLREAEQQVARIISERARMVDALQSLDIVEHIWPSDANFLLVRVADARALLEHTGADRVLVRHFDGELADCVRISIGTNDENDALLASLAKLETADA